ncbi:MAG: crotonase/enoyl-CoA hydratase family protein [Acidimicrobiia bacterium]|nr:crotonase/enoyl-CoA hydratase family protein [Acidimicrobiia bacterium]
MTSEVLTIEVSDDVATVWLDRPEKLNAMNLPFWQDFPQALAALGEDDAVRAIVIAGRGKAFSVGIDLALFGDLERNESSDSGSSQAGRNMRFYKLLKRMQGTMTAAEHCPKPVIAAIHGYCLGGAVDLITACDIRLASADAIFSVRETKLGMVADVGTVQRLPRVLAPGHAAELLYTGKDITAARAKEIGLVNDVLPDAEAVQKAAHELAAEIAANSPLVVQGLKAVIQAGEGRSVAEALDYMAIWNSAFIRSNDLVEGLASQIEGREPKFTGE